MEEMEEIKVGLDDGVEHAMQDYSVINHLLHFELVSGTFQRLRTVRFEKSSRDPWKRGEGLCDPLEPLVGYKMN